MSFRSRSQLVSALVEFALAAPLGILALAGTFQFGYAVSKPPRIDLKLSALAR